MGVPGAFGPCLWEPCQVAVPTPQVSVCCGAHFTLSLDDRGCLHQWGCDVDAVLRVPTKVAGGLRGKTVTRIACGSKHSLALTDAFEVFSWGLGSSGQLGHGDAPTIPSPQPKQINSLRDRHRDPPATVHAGGNTSGIVTARKELLLWGSNQFGQVSGAGNDGVGWGGGWMVQERKADLVFDIDARWCSFVVAAACSSRWQSDS